MSGGTLQDLILDRHPLYWTHDWVLSAVIGVVAVATLALPTSSPRPPRERDESYAPM